MQERKPGSTDKRSYVRRRPSPPMRKKPTSPGLSIDESFDEGSDPYNNTRPGVVPRYRKD